MKVNKVKRAIFAAFAAVFVFVAPAVAANVAKIGDVEYATIDAAVAAWKPGEMIELLTDIERDSYFVFTQNTYALDGKGHTIKCTKAHSKSWKYFVNANAGTQTFKNIIIDGNGKVPFVMQAIDGGKLILENVTIKGAKTTTTGSLFSRSTSLGYGIHVNDGSVEAKNITITNCEVADVYQDGASSSFTLSGDNCNVNFIGSSSAKESVTSTAKGYYAYEVTYKSNLGNGTAKTISNKSLNGIIDQVQKSITTIVASFPVSVEIKSATVKLLQDVDLAEAFTSNDTKLTINGNGKTITGTFKFSSTPSPISSAVIGNGSVLDCTASTMTGFSGVSVAANTTIDILLPASTDMNSYALPVSLATDAVANIFVGDKKYIAKNGVISSAEKLAQIGDKQYATLQEAIDAANGATVQVLKDVALISSLTVPAGKTLTLNLAGRKVTVSGADYALVNNGDLKIVDMGLVTVVAAEATIGDETAAPILIMAPSANDGIAVVDDATGGSIAGIQNNGSLTLESGAVVAAAANVPAIDNAANAVAAITGGTVEGTLQSVDKNALTITGGSFTGNSNVSEFLDDNYGVDSNGTVISYVAQLGETKYQTLEAAFAAAKEFDVVAVLDDSADVSGIAAYVAQGLFPISNGDKTYTLRTLPKATVEKLPAFTLTKARDAYMCWPNGDAEIDRPLDIVMNFLANDDGKAEANESGFADWKCDFYLTLSDMAGSSITADGCYLAGNYGGFGWIVIPVDGEPLNNSDTYPVVAAYDANITYRQVCESVKKFTAAIHVADAIMEANPDLKITLQLKMTNDKDSAQELVVGSYTYTIDDLKGRLNPPVNVEANVTVDDVFKANVGSGLANAYQAAEGKLNITIVEKGDTFSLIDVSAQDDYGFPAEGLAMTFPAQSVADGEAAIVVHEHDGKKYVFTGIVEYGYVTYNNILGFSEFTVGDTAALNAAIAEGGEIVLSSDIVLSETLVIPAGKTVTLDLNGKKLSHADEANKYAINNLGTLTLKDSVGTGSVDARGIYNGYGNGADNVATAKIIIQSGTYNAKGTNGGAAIFNYGIAEINGGSFTSIGGYSLNNQAGSSMTIADGVTANNGIYCSNANVTVNGGNISGNRSGCHVVYAWNAELTINGGTFYNNNSGNATIMSAGTTKCTITGGTFGIEDGRVEGNGNTWTSCLTDTANTATMTVTGGIFNGGFRVQAGTTMTIEGGSFNDVGGSKYNIYGTVSVKGGTFTDTTAQNFAKDNLADGFELYVGGNVVEILAVAQIGEIKYATLSEALAAANSGDTVTLLTNVEISDSILLDKSLTLDLGGNTITSSNNRSIKINTSGNAAEEIVIKNGTVVSTPDGGRCIQLGGDSLKTLELNGLTLKAENGQYTQTITLAETNSTEPLEFVVKNSTVVASDNNGYAVIFFCPVDVTVEESTMSGYAALYFKNFGAANDSSGSEVSIKDSHLIGTNVQGGKNTFGTISTEADNIAITVSGGSITAQKTNASIQTIVYCGWSNDESTGLNASFDTELILGEGCRILDEFEDLSVQTVSVRAEYAQSLKDAGYAVQPVEGATGMIQISDAVAEVNGVGFATLSEAFAAVTDDAQTVTVLKDVTENLVGVYLRGNIVPAEGKNITVTLTNDDWVYCPYTFVVGAGITLNVPALFYYAGGTQINGTLIVDAYYQMYAGTKLTINEPGSMTVTTEQFYLRYTDGDANAGIYINGDNDDSTIGLNTSVIYFYQGMINAKNANIKTSVYWQTNETDGQGSANLVLDNSKLNVTVNEQKVKATGNSTVTLTNGSELIAPGGFEVGGVLKSSCDITGAISKISDQATIEISGGTYTQDVSDWCVDGYAAVKTLDNKYVVSAMPTATVSNLGSITVGLGDYKADAYMMYDIINGGKLQEATVPYDLTLAMDFKAKDTAETAAQNAFGNYTTDFFITMSGMSQASFVGNGCYLAGYYPSFKAWVKIPLDGFTVENGKVYPVITSAGFDFKYTDICGTVGQFICGIYLTPEVLAANPNLTVDLTLGLAENKDAALNAQFFKVDNYVYDADDLQPVTLPEVVITDIKSTLTDADPDLTFALNFAIKDVDKLSEEYLEKLFAKYGDYYTDYVLTISGLTDSNGSVKFNANGNGDGYLAGQYDAWSKSWVTVPFSDVTVKNGQSFYIMEYAAELMNKGGLRLTLKEVAEIVKNFDCGVYFTPEFLAANPNLKVELELKVFTEDGSGNKVGDISVATNTFDKDDFSVEAAKLDIRIVNGKPQIGFAGEGELVLNAATALTGEWTKNIEYTAVENDGDDTKTWVTPKDGYYFFKGYIVR